MRNHIHTLQDDYRYYSTNCTAERYMILFIRRTIIPCILSIQHLLIIKSKKEAYDGAHQALPNIMSFIFKIIKDYLPLVQELLGTLNPCKHKYLIVKQLNTDKIKNKTAKKSQGVLAATASHAKYEINELERQGFRCCISHLHATSAQLQTGNISSASHRNLIGQQKNSNMKHVTKKFYNKQAFCIPDSNSDCCYLNI